MAKDDDVKYCPMIDKLCIKSDCGWYNDIINVCAVNIIPFNLYKMSNSIEECTNEIKLHTEVLAKVTNNLVEAYNDLRKKTNG